MSDVFVELFIACFRELYDEEYCHAVVETTAELAERRRVEYRGKRGVTYVLNLPRGDRPYVRFAVDYKRKKGLVLTLVGDGYIVFLTYERDEGKFRPVHAEMVNAEIAAAANHNLPTGVLQRLMSRTQTT